MNDCVIDATIVCLSNQALANRAPGSPLDQRLRVIELVISAIRRVRFNARLLSEYERVARKHQNDLIQLFFAILDSPKAVRVSRNSLSRQVYAAAVGDCGWPSHDQHLIAAALDGVNPCICVTESHHAVCSELIWRRLKIQIEHIH